MSSLRTAVEINGDLLNFVTWFCTNRGSGSNLMQMAAHNICQLELDVKMGRKLNQSSYHLMIMYPLAGQV